MYFLLRHLLFTDWRMYTRVFMNGRNWVNSIAYRLLLSKKPRVTNCSCLFFLQFFFKSISQEAYRTKNVLLDKLKKNPNVFKEQ